MAKSGVGKSLLGFILVLAILPATCIREKTEDQKVKRQETELSRKIDEIVKIVEQSQEKPSKWNFGTIVIVLLGGIVSIGFIARNAEKARLQQEEERKRQYDTYNSGLMQRLTIENERNYNRDIEFQTTPYRFRLSRHAANTLALRYGIAHVEQGQDDYTNPKQQTHISLKKTGKVTSDDYGGEIDSNSAFKVELADYKSKPAIAIIEGDTVLTFYPLKKSWFGKNAALETKLKDNSTFNLKEIAAFHVQLAH